MSLIGVNILGCFILFLKLIMLSSDNKKKTHTNTHEVKIVLLCFLKINFHEIQKANVDFKTYFGLIGKPLIHSPNK